MSTLSQLITQVRDEISEPSPGFVSDAEVTRWLNRANYDLADVAGVEQSTSSTVTTVASTESYSLPSGFGLMEQAEIVDDAANNTYVELRPIDLNQRIDGEGKPDAWYILGDLLFLNPRPDAVYTVKLWYYKAGVTLVSAGDTPIIAAKYHDLLPLYAIAMAKRKSDDPAYVTYLNDYLAGRGGMIEFLRQKGQGNRFRTVVDVDPW